MVPQAGGDLAQRIAAARRTRSHFSEPQVLDWFWQVASALHHVYAQRILHRDLKTQNIFLTRGNLVKLGDFGIARVLSNSKSLARTVTGTPYYMSPEPVEKNQKNNPQIWAFCWIV